MTDIPTRKIIALAMIALRNYVSNNISCKKPVEDSVSRYARTTEGGTFQVVKNRLAAIGLKF